MRRLVALYFVGMFFNLFLPTAIGGDAVRAYLLRGATRRTDVSVASIFLERLCGFAVLMTIAALALLLCYPRLRGSPVAAVVLVVIGLFVVGVILLINRRVARLAAGLADRLPGQRLWRAAGRIHEAILRYRGHGGALAQVVALSFLVQAMSIGTYWLMAASMGLRPPVALWAALVPVVIVASMVPISLGGLGVREGAAVYVFPLAAMTADQAVAVSLLFFSVTVACSLAGAALLPLQRSATALARQVGG